MKVSINIEERSGCGGPVYNEPYEGFFKKQGFNVDRAFGLCELSDSYEKRITLESTLNKDNEFSLTPVITSERVIFYQRGDVSLNFGKFACGSLDDPKAVKCTSLYDIIQKEKSGEDTTTTIKTMLEAVEKSGGKTWSGYIVSLATNGSHQIALMKEDFTGARNLVEAFVDYAVQTALDIYSKLDTKKINALIRKLPQLSETLITEFCDTIQYAVSSSQYAVSSSFEDVIESLPEMEQYQRAREVVENPINVWLPKFEMELRKAGIDHCEKEFYDKISDYCSFNGIKLVKAEFGTDFRKSMFTGMLGDAMK